jgi:hypothetical protein
VHQAVRRLRRLAGRDAPLAQPAELFLEGVQLGLAGVLQIGEQVACLARAAELVELLVDDGVPARRPWHAINVSIVPTLAHGFLVPGSARRAVRALCYLLPRCQSCWWWMTSRTC